MTAGAGSHASVVIAAVAAVSIAAAGAAPQMIGVAAKDTSGIPFTCGEDQRLINELPVFWQFVVLAGDARQYAPCPILGPNPNHPENHRERREMRVIYRALQSRDAELRRVATQARARLGFPAEQALLDGDPQVRLEALYSFITYSPEAEIAAVQSQLLPGAKPVPYVDKTFETLAVRAVREPFLDPRDAIYDAMGQAPYYDAKLRDSAELFLASRAGVTDARLSYAATRGLEALLRQDRARKISAGALDALRGVIGNSLGIGEVPLSGGIGTVAVLGPAEYAARARRLAMYALTTIGDGHIETVQRAATDGDWQVRRLAVARIDLAEERFIQTIAQIVDDPAFQVRYEIVNVEARHAARTHLCVPLLRRFNDETLIVQLRAAEVVPDECTDEADVVRILKDWTESLDRAEATNWHKPARALVALGRIDKESAASLLEVAAKHPVWQIRAAAADLAGRMNDQQTLVALSADAEPNVRTAVIVSLQQYKNDALFATAMEALKNNDFQLVAVAANGLRLAPEGVRDDAARALLDAFARLTELKSDTSRDPRLAILQRLEEVLPADRGTDLAPFLNDLDVAVRRTALDISMRMLALKERPVTNPLRRYPLQPAPDELTNLPGRAVIHMDGGGQIEIELYPRTAPVTVARFVALVRIGHYNGLTFHRVVPNFMVQGGSPTGNDYGGVSRFIRDELSFRPHVRGALGMSSRGPDAGDGQIFIDLVDLPQLDHTYTVFGQAISGLDVLDRMLEGAKIQAISLK